MKYDLFNERHGRRIALAMRRYAKRQARRWQVPLAIREFYQERSAEYDELMAHELDYEPEYHYTPLNYELDYPINDDDWDQHLYDLDPMDFV